MASDVSAANWRYQTHVKEYRIFSRVLSGLQILVKHRCLDEKIRVTYEKLGYFVCLEVFNFYSIIFPQSQFANDLHASVKQRKKRRQ